MRRRPPPQAGRGIKLKPCAASSTPSSILLALFFLIEAWLWDHLRPLVAAVVNVVAWDRLKARLAALVEWLPPGRC